MPNAAALEYPIRPRGAQSLRTSQYDLAPPRRDRGDNTIRPADASATDRGGVASFVSALHELALAPAYASCTPTSDALANKRS
jgi:hypothetical protein